MFNKLLFKKICQISNYAEKRIFSYTAGSRLSGMFLEGRNKTGTQKWAHKVYHSIPNVSDR